MSLESYMESLDIAEFRPVRRKTCRVLATELAACGDRLWAFGFGPRDLRTASSIVIQFGGSLATGAVALGDEKNFYAASALVRQFVEVEYLVRLFRRDDAEALRWLSASPDDLRAFFRPAQMRKRAGDFRHQEYSVHCSVGGHPNPRAHHLLPGRYLKEHLPPGTAEAFWVDLGQHLCRIWRDIAVLPLEHPKANLEIVRPYSEKVADAIDEWEATDPCSKLLPVSMLQERGTDDDSA
jgi:hypothetical protein